jgi:hypothetical protein
MDAKQAGHLTGIWIVRAAFVALFVWWLFKFHGFLPN